MVRKPTLNERRALFIQSFAQRKSDRIAAPLGRNRNEGFPKRRKIFLNVNRNGNDEKAVNGK